MIKDSIKEQCHLLKEQKLLQQLKPKKPFQNQYKQNNLFQKGPNNFKIDPKNLCEPNYNLINLVKINQNLLNIKNKVLYCIKINKKIIKNIIVQNHNK